MMALSSMSSLKIFVLKVNFGENLLNLRHMEHADCICILLEKFSHGMSYPLVL